MSSSVMRSGLMCLSFDFGSQSAEGVHQLRAAAVIQGQGKGGAGVAGGGVLGPAHLVLHLGRQFVGAADVLHAHIVVHHALHVALQVGLEQAHEEVDLGAGAAQAVLKGKGVEREPGQADAGGCFSNQSARFWRPAGGPGSA